MSKRLTITLSNEEYAALEAEAAQERRSVREMAAYLVARKPLLHQLIPYTAPSYPWQPITITSDRTGSSIRTVNPNDYTTCNALN